MWTRGSRKGDLGCPGPTLLWELRHWACEAQGWGDVTPPSMGLVGQRSCSVWAQPESAPVTLWGSLGAVVQHGRAPAPGWYQPWEELRHSWAPPSRLFGASSSQCTWGAAGVGSPVHLQRMGPFSTSFRVPGVLHSSKLSFCAEKSYKLTSSQASGRRPSKAGGALSFSVTKTRALGPNCGDLGAQ